MKIKRILVGVFAILVVVLLAAFISLKMVLFSPVFILKASILVLLLVAFVFIGLGQVIYGKRKKDK